jgi:hypothetical protein
MPRWYKPNQTKQVEVKLGQKVVFAITWGSALILDFFYHHLLLSTNRLSTPSQSYERPVTIISFSSPLRRCPAGLPKPDRHSIAQPSARRETPEM